MKISNITKKMGDFELSVKDMYIPLSAGSKIYGLAGENGSGKTTLMKIIAKVVEADSGEIDYEGLIDSDITMVFRRPYLMGDTVLNNLLYPLKIRKQKPDQAKVEYFLETASLQNMRNKYAPGLSGGQQQKLALIRAMIFNPKLVLIDESFSNLDKTSVEIFESFIKERSIQDKISFIICSHQESQIKNICEKVFNL